MCSVVALSSMCSCVTGGKTTALAELIGDKGEIIALDRTHDKVRVAYSRSVPRATLAQRCLTSSQHCELWWRKEWMLGFSFSASTIQVLVNALYKLYSDM
jgi:hypothetical protein